MRKAHAGLFEYTTPNQDSTAAAATAGSLPVITAELFFAIDFLELADNVVL